MSRSMSSHCALVRVLLALAVAAAACGGQQPSSQETPTPSGAASSQPSPPPPAATVLSSDQICARIQVASAQQATGDQWSRSAVIGEPPSCDFTDAGDDRLSIATTTYPSKQVADMAWTVGFPSNMQPVRGIGRQAVFGTVSDLSGGTQAQLYFRIDDTHQYQIRLTSARIGGNAAALRDACQKVAQLLLSQ